MYTIGGKLYHHGVLGMKWGVRRYQPYSQGYQAKGKVGKFIGENSKQGKPISNETRKAVKNYRKVFDNALKFEDRINDAMVRENDLAAKKEQKWQDVQRAYEKTGKIFAERVLNNILYDIEKKNPDKKTKLSNKNRKNVEKYIKEYDRYQTAEDKHDEAQSRVYDLRRQEEDAWKEVRKAFKPTGRFYVERVINNIKYDIEESKKKKKVDINKQGEMSDEHFDAYSKAANAISTYKDDKSFKKKFGIERKEAIKVINDDFEEYKKAYEEDPSNNEKLIDYLNMWQFKDYIDRNGSNKQNTKKRKNK